MSKKRFKIKNYEQDWLSIVNEQVSFKPMKIDRQSECYYCSELGFGNLGETHRLPSAEVHINPHGTSAADLLEILERDNSQLSFDERFDFREEYPEEYDSKWICNDSVGTFEMTFILVAYRGDNVVGFANVGVAFFPPERRRESDSYSCYFLIYPRLAYVIKKERGKGYGFDLSVASSNVVCKLLHAMYKSVKNETVIYPSMGSRYPTKDGRDLFRYMIKRLDRTIDGILRWGGRGTVTVNDLSTNIRNMRGKL